MLLGNLLFIVFVAAALVVFYLGVPTHWFKERRGRDLDIGGGHRSDRERRAH